MTLRPRRPGPPVTVRFIDGPMAPGAGPVHPALLLPPLALALAEALDNGGEFLLGHYRIDETPGGLVGRWVPNAELPPEENGS